MSSSQRGSGSASGRKPPHLKVLPKQTSDYDNSQPDAAPPFHKFHNSVVTGTCLFQGLKLSKSMQKFFVWFLKKTRIKVQFSSNNDSIPGKPIRLLPAPPPPLITVLSHWEFPWESQLQQGHATQTTVLGGLMMMPFSSLARISGECSTIHSPLSLFFFFEVEISSRTLIPLFMPGSVHSGSASWDNHGQMFPDKLHESSFPNRFAR